MRTLEDEMSESKSDAAKADNRDLIWKIIRLFVVFIATMIAEALLEHFVWHEFAGVGTVIFMGYFVMTFPGVFGLKWINDD